MAVYVLRQQMYPRAIQEKWTSFLFILISTETFCFNVVRQE